MSYFPHRLLPLYNIHHAIAVELLADYRESRISDDVPIIQKFEKYLIEELDVDLDKKRLKNTMKALYLEACDLEL